MRLPIRALAGYSGAFGLRLADGLYTAPAF